MFTLKDLLEDAYISIHKLREMLAASRRQNEILSESLAKWRHRAERAQRVNRMVLDALEKANER